MKKYFFLFAVSSFFCTAHAFAQSRATGEKGQAAVVAEPQNSSPDTSPRGTVSKAGKNQQSVYTPPAEGSNNASGTGTPSSQQAAPEQVQPATVDPKKPE